jgi:hypothetical protein
MHLNWHETSKFDHIKYFGGYNQTVIYVGGRRRRRMYDSEITPSQRHQK